jgi:hypothetical protein
MRKTNSFGKQASLAGTAVDKEHNVVLPGSFLVIGVDHI